ncbi:MAG: hydroxymethylbilane synthase [Betaproteobacteria bacterium]|nr:hydroxymethylbilane synthase [Betaproteobacteria bacterium]
MNTDRLVIASRESRLALWQAEHVRDALRQLYPSRVIEILGMTTQGDRILDVSLSRIGGKGLFVKELEVAMTEGRADFAVHSAKDVPMMLPPGFCIAATLKREDPRDCWVSARYGSIDLLPRGARVGSSSLRREAQIRARYAHIEVVPVRGNLDTRLSKLDRGEVDVLVLAAAGLKRLGLAGRIGGFISPEHSLPAPGQGALTIECREDRTDLIGLLACLNDPDTDVCVRAERSASRALSGSCQLPLAVFGEIEAGQLRLRGLVATKDGRTVLRAELRGSPKDAESLGGRLSAQLRESGADRILAAL